MKSTKYNKNTLTNSPNNNSYSLNKLSFSSFIRFSLLLVILSQILFISLAETPGSENHNRDSGLLRVVGGEDFPPFIYKNSEGNTEGIDVDLWKLWSRKTGVEVDWKLVPWKNAIPLLLAGKVDVVDGVTPTKERKKFLDFSPVYNTGDTYIFYHQDLGTFNSLTDLEGFPVGVLNKTVNENLLRDSGVKLTVVPYNGFGQLIEAARSGKIAVFIGEEPTCSYYLSQTGGMKGFRRSILPIHTTPLCMAVRKGDTKTLKLVNDGLSEISKDELQQILSRYTEIGSSFEEYGRLLLWFLCGTCIILILFFLWNLQLRRRVADSTRDLRESEEDLLITLNSIGDAVISTDIKGLVTRINPVAEEITGWKTEDAVGRPLEQVCRIINSETRKPVNNPVQKVIDSGEIVGLANHTVLLRRDGQERQIADSGAPIRNDKDEIKGVVLVFRDVTEKYRLEEELRHAQKMESVGQIAGGVAHDFNNIIGGIMGANELLEMKIGDNKTLKRLVDLISNATRRASEVTAKLLAFSRKTKREVKPIDVHMIINDALGLLKPSIDRRIKVDCDLNADDVYVSGDYTMLQNMVLNLGVNARDAMPEGGTLTISTRNVQLDENHCDSSSFSLSPGKFVVIEVKDTGCGISPDAQGRVFEPFFTTKEKGKGTGLGLAAVYNTVKNHNGAIDFLSEVGKGTLFRVELPVISKSEQSDEVVVQTKTKGCVLIVDDEEIARKLVKLMLQDLGYSVLSAENGKSALKIIRKKKDQIDLVLLDMILPEMDGKKIFREIKKISPKTHVILVSGYLPPRDLADLYEQGVLGFLKKPYGKEELAHLVENIVKM